MSGELDGWMDGWMAGWLAGRKASRLAGHRGIGDMSTREMPSNLEKSKPSRAGKTQSQEATPTPDHTRMKAAFVTPGRPPAYLIIRPSFSGLLNTYQQVRSAGDLDEYASRDLAEVKRGRRRVGLILQLIAWTSAYSVNIVPGAHAGGSSTDRASNGGAYTLPTADRWGAGVKAHTSRRLFLDPCSE